MAKRPEQKKYTKSNLPAKPCENCGKPMMWRKKWEKVWTEVKFCILLGKMPPEQEK